MAATIHDIASTAGTSKSTVSRYLNGGSISHEKSEAIEKAIAALGYTPNVNARRLVSNCTHMIGVVFDDISDYIYGDMMAGFQSAAYKEGYNCMYLSRATEWEKESDSLSLFASSMVDGLISVTLRQRDPEQVRIMERSGLPVVLVGDPAGESGLPVVDVDNMNGTRSEIDHLLSLGHTRIAYLRGPDSMPAAHSRLRGYYRALEGAGIPVDEKLIRPVSWSVKDAYQVVTELLAQESFTALAASNAYSTYGSLQAILDSGRRVPEDIAVIGFDDAAICEHTRPAISTLRQPFTQIGSMAAKQVISLIRGETDAVCATYVMPKLILRETAK